MSVENTINELLSQANKIKSLNEEALNLTEADLELLTQDEIASLVENIDQLDELSKKTLGDYVKKATVRVSAHSGQMGKEENKGKDKDYGEWYRQMRRGLKKQDGIHKAVNRLTKESLDEMSQDELSELVENFDQLDEVSRATLAQYIGSFEDMNDIDNAAEETRKAKGKISDKDANDNTNGARVGDETKDRVISKIASFAKGEQTLTAESLDEMDQDEFDLFVESAELLDELSKKTLGNYINKSVDDSAHNRAYGAYLHDKLNDTTQKLRKTSVKAKRDAFMDQIDDQKKDLKKAMQKALKRDAGVKTAANKLAKEDIDLGALFEGHDLTEDFKSKATTIFETAVATRVASELAIREDDLVESVSDEMDELTEGLVYKIDGFLSYMAEQWMQKNELALDRGIKAELFESFVSGMKTLFEEHYINVPEDEFDALDEMHQQTEALEAALNESTQHNIELSNTLKEISKQMQIEEATEGLSELQAEKFTQLAENIVFENEESFGEKLDVIRENYFSTVEKQVANKQVFMSDAPVESLTEEVNVNVNKDVARYASFIK